MKRRNSININLGISSILLIFFVLSLVSFAVLSLSSALNGYKLTSKTIAKNLTYYDACNEMQDLLEDLDKEYMEIYVYSSSVDAYMTSCSEHTQLSVPVNDTQALIVDVEPVYPRNETDHLYRITSWKLTQVVEPHIDFTIPVFK